MFDVNEWSQYYYNQSNHIFRNRIAHAMIYVKRTKKSNNL